MLTRLVGDLRKHRARPADTPVDQPTRLKLIPNLRTAKAMSIAVPPPLLSQANDVID